MKRLSAPANAEELKAYYAACKKVGAEPADTLRKLAKALVDHVDEHGFWILPIKFAAVPPKKTDAESDRA